VKLKVIYLIVLIFKAKIITTLCSYGVHYKLSVLAHLYSASLRETDQRRSTPNTNVRGKATKRSSCCRLL